jgi:hypothetical protein
MKNPILLSLLLAISASAQTITAHRPPAVPLITNDPFFSIWSVADNLTDANTKHWSDSDQRMTGLARIDGKTFRWMGREPRLPANTPPSATMHQVSLEITPLHTKYLFEAAGIELHVTFFTPLFPKDLDVLSRPVTYLSWSAAATDGQPHKVDLLLDVDPQIAVNDASQPVTWGRAHVTGLTVLNVGSRDQATLHQSGDRVRIDWGYFHLAAPDAAGTTTELSRDAMAQFSANGTLDDMDALDMPRTLGGAQGPAAHLAIELALGTVTAKPVERHVLLAYTEGYAIEYLGRKLRPYWQRNGMTESELLATAEKQYPELEQRGEAFDRELTADMKHVGGDDYAYLTALAFRQTIAAHKLTADIDGTPMLFSKENDSGGFIDTVDVTYPSSPFFLLFNPKLLEAQLEPTMRYAALPRWPFPFAPHDLGSYPLADGQLYGGGEKTEDDQMPVEESGNLILDIAAMEREEGNWDFAKRFMPQLTRWAAYLQEKGMDPENQLSTDDFSGHLAHNANLSIKAIEALGAFAEIARQTGDTKLADHYEALVKPLPAQWEKLAADNGHYKLAFDVPGSWSQKYNLVWDHILDLNLFPPSVAKAECTWYATQMQPYGLPLDSRKTFTKLDWEVWTASLTDDPQQFHDLIHRLATWADNTPSRVPLTDWYDTVSGKQMGFQARSVVGGIFVPALLDPHIAKKWLDMPTDPSK